MVTKKLKIILMITLKINRKKILYIYICRVKEVFADELVNDFADKEDPEEIPDQVPFPESLDEATRKILKRKKNKLGHLNNYHQKTRLFKRWKDTKI